MPDSEVVGRHGPTEGSTESAGLALVDPGAYADGRLETALGQLRSADPVHRVEAEDFDTFYAVTRHSDIRLVERDSDTWRAAPRYRLYRQSEAAGASRVRSLVRMDPPEHTAYRALVRDWFHPRNLKGLEQEVASLARDTVDVMARRSGEYDFVTEVAMQLPLTVICKMLGVPTSDRELIKTLTLKAFGAEDPEYQQLSTTLGDADSASQISTYFRSVVSDRLANPGEDLSTVLAHAELDGRPLPDADLYGYFGILASAGHDTTASTLAGGLQALVEHPDQLERLRRDPDLVPSAVEEIIRWVSPVKSFMRTATRDTELRGVRIGSGESVLLLYPSANFDEEVFRDPYTFDVGREPNDHLAFGHGAHFCLGAHLARLEARAFFRELIPRLDAIELTARPQRVMTLFVGGLKHLPIRTDVS